MIFLSKVSVCGKMLFAIEEVQDIEATIGSVSITKGTVQRFKSWLKSQCKNKKYVYLKNNMLYNSKCHQSNPCSNK